MITVSLRGGPGHQHLPKASLMSASSGLSQDHNLPAVLMLYSRFLEEEVAEKNQ